MYRDATYIQRGEPDYPAPLRPIASDEEAAPAGIWVRGRVPAGRLVAVVGARAATAGALVAARTIAQHLAEADVTVVSGGAVGVDGAAHRGALDVGGRTVVVLGTGIDVVYPPQHGSLFDEAAAQGGAVVSPFSRSQEATKWGFPRRNKLIAALSDTVIVVEAGTKSGALYTADAAFRRGRRVVVLLGSDGCDRLAARGAESARSVEELIGCVLGASKGVRQPSLFDAAPALESSHSLSEGPEDERARRLYEALDHTPRDLGLVAAQAGLSASEALALAIDLEVGGFAARAAGGRYLRLRPTSGHRAATSVRGATDAN